MGRAVAFIVVLALVAGPLVGVRAATEPPCRSPEEWESPPRIQQERWCRAVDADHAFWALAGDTVNLFTRPDPDQDVVLCIVDPTGFVPFCSDSGPEGDSEIINGWSSTQTGWWRSRVFASAPYSLHVSSSNSFSEDDCSFGHDASAAFGPAHERGDTPRLSVCTGQLVAQDIADFYQDDLEIGGRLVLSTDVASRLCAYAPRGGLAGGCADVAAGGSFTHDLDETGPWRYAVLHPSAGGSTGAYELTANYTPPNHAPSMVFLACAPGGHAQDQLACRFRANEPDGDLLHYLVDWGDGSPAQRVPSAGEVSHSFDRSASHAYAAVGTYAVRVVAVDERAPALESAPSVTSVLVHHARPSFEPIACAPIAPRPGDEVICSFRANDDSSGLFYVARWSDGQTLRVPETGYLAPGGTHTLARTLYGKGTHTLNVTANDNGTPVGTGWASISLLVAANPPSAPSVECGSGTRVAPVVSCTLTASDSDSAGVFYTLEMEGVTRSIPANGYVAPGAPEPVTLEFSRTGYHTVRVRATDDTPIAQIGPWTSVEFIVGQMQIVNGANPAGSGLGASALAGPSAPPVDGTWVKLAATGRGNASTPVRLTPGTMPIGSDLDVWFYASDRATRLGAGLCSRAGVATEACDAPPGAEWAFVSSAALTLRAEWRLTYVH